MSMDQPRDRRIRVKAPVSFEGKSGTGRGNTFNLSLGGCALECGTDIDMNATIKLHLRIPTDTKPVTVGRAKIVWTAGSDCGVEFVDMNETGKARLKNYIDSLQLKIPTPPKS
jgi:c-di-GMP-binding flagellar brake protein YcgR